MLIEHCHYKLGMYMIDDFFIANDEFILGSVPDPLPTTIFKASFRCVVMP